MKSRTRFLKDTGARLAKESSLEKPYQGRDYQEMHQYPDVPLPPVVDDPPPGTGGLTCWYSEEGCEQLVGCWTGSDISLEGPLAHEAGYIEPNVIKGELIKWETSGLDDRGIEITMNPAVSENVFEVRFKDGNGEIHSFSLAITCNPYVDWTEVTAVPTQGIYGAHIDNNQDLHFTGQNVTTNTSIDHNKWNGASWTTTTILTNAKALGIGGSGNTIYIFYQTASEWRLATYNGSWSTELVKTSTDVIDSTDYASIFEDSSGYIHIFCSDKTNHELEHLTNSSGSWASEVVYTGNFIGRGRASIDLNSDVIHACFFVRDTSLNYKVLHFEGGWGSWTTTTLTTAVAAYTHADLVVVDNTAYMVGKGPNFRDITYGIITTGGSLSSGTFSTSNLFTYYDQVCHYINGKMVIIDGWEYHKNGSFAEVDFIAFDGSMRGIIDDTVNRIKYAYSGSNYKIYAKAY